LAILEERSYTIQNENFMLDNLIACFIDERNMDN